MSIVYLTTFLRRGALMPFFTVIVLIVTVPIVWGASSSTKITIHIPGKTLAVMVFYFAKDKGFFSQEKESTRSSWRWHRPQRLLR